MVENAHHSLPIRITEGSGKFIPFITGVNVIPRFSIVVLSAMLKSSVAAAKGRSPTAIEEISFRQRETILLRLRKDISCWEMI
jgi:hypothetical protein